MYDKLLEELTAMNGNAKSLLEKYDNAGVKLDEKTKELLEELSIEIKKGLESLTVLTNGSSVARIINKVLQDKDGNGLLNKAIAFSVGCSDGHTTITTGTTNAVPFNAVSVDTHNAFIPSETTPRFKAPVSGFYSLHLSITYSGSFNATHNQLFWNNKTPNKAFILSSSPYLTIVNSQGTYPKQQITNLAYIEEGCELEPACYQDSGASATIRRGMSYASGFLIGVK